MALPLSPRFLLRVVRLALPVLFLCGCASVGVAPGPEQGGPAGGRKPERLVIVPFDYDRCALNVDRTGAGLEAFKKALADGLASDIALRTPPLGLAPAIEPKPPGGREAAWLVRGGFTRVNQGSRAARAALGFGLGGTKMETRVEVYDLSSDSLTPLFSFDTSGGSGASPGAVASTTPYGAAASLALGSVAGVEDDRERTARMIVAYVGERLAAKGWLPPGTKPGAAKRLDAEDTGKLRGDPAPDASFDTDTATVSAQKRTGARSK